MTTGGGGDGIGTGGGGAGREGTNPLHWKDPQSTGRDKNALHWPAERCAGRLGRQFLRSSKPGSAKHLGGSPVKKLYEKVKFSNLGSAQMLSGIFPESKLCATLSCSMLSNPPKLSGMGPNSWLKLTSKTVRFLSFPISGDRQDLKALFIMMISLRLVMLPRPEGTHPWNLLLARTMTDTGELPKLSGRSKTNLLWLMKMASKGLSKSSLGTVPSNSLNLRSRNLSVGRSKTTLGNRPANRLLLRSSSKRSFKRPNFLGTVPQKRLELMWNNARSTKRPSSSGRYPAMSPWLRSMPATVWTEGSSSAGAQKTPV